MTYIQGLNELAGEIADYFRQGVVIGLGAAAIGGTIVLVNRAITFLEEAQERQTQEAFRRESIE